MRVHLCVRAQKLYNVSLTRMTAKQLTCTSAKLHSYGHNGSNES